MYALLLTAALLGAEAEQEKLSDRLPGAEAEQEKLSAHPTMRAMHQEAIRRRGGRPIELDEECCQIAQRWANHMARTRSFGHGGGEQIIARGYPTVQACFSGWMNSPGHRSWILRKSDRCGWGFQRSSGGHCYWVGVFRNGKAK